MGPCPRTKKSRGLANPVLLKPFEKDEIVVIIETPKGSRNKYAYEPDQRIFTLKKVLPAGMAFPYDFGFVPRPWAEMVILWMCSCSWTSPPFTAASSRRE